MAARLLSVADAVARKKAQGVTVSRAALYLAIREGRLPSTLVLGKIGLKEKDVDEYEPLPAERKGIVLGKNVRTTQKRRKKQSEETSSPVVISSENGTEQATAGNDGKEAGQHGE